MKNELDDILPYYMESPDVDDEPKRCRYCRGTGNDGGGSNYYPCPDCNGHGYIKKEKENE